MANLGWYLHHTHFVTFKFTSIARNKKELLWQQEEGRGKEWKEERNRQREEERERTEGKKRTDSMSRSGTDSDE